MRVLFQPIIACGVFVFMWRTPISTAAIQHHTSRVRSLVNRRRAATTTTGRAAARSGGNGSRELSAEDQLDILRLGFIPTSRDEYGGECKPRRNNAVRGGGSFEDNSAPRRRSNKVSCRELTAQEQLDILRLGFIPISRDEEESKARGLMRFIPRGGSIQSAPQQQHCRELSAEEQLDILRLGFIPRTCNTSDDDDEESETYSLTRLIGLRGGSMESTPQPQHCSRELSAEEQLDILRLGFIPPSSPSHTRYYAYNPRFSRGGSIDEASSVVSKERRAIHPFAFAAIMAGLAGCSNVICMHKFNCYATMMTGNVVMLSLAISEQQWKDVLWRMSLIGSYVIGSASVRCIELLYQEFSSQTTKKSDKHHIRAAVAPIVAIVFAIANQLIIKDIGQRYKIAMLALGYGMVYSTANQQLSSITQLLTNHITKLGTLMGTTLSTRKTTSWNSEASKSVCIIGSFIIGGIFGGHLLQVIPTDFPFFTLLGIVYALVLEFC